MKDSKGNFESDSIFSFELNEDLLSSHILYQFNELSINSSYIDHVVTNADDKLDIERIKKTFNRTNIFPVDIEEKSSTIKDNLDSNFRSFVFDFESKSGYKLDSYEQIYFKDFLSHEENIFVKEIYTSSGRDESSIKDYISYKINDNPLSISKKTEASDVNTNYTELENDPNRIYLNRLNSDVTPILLNYIKHEDFEFGESSPSINIVEEHLNENEYITKEWFNKLYLKFYSRVDIFIGLLRIVEFIGKDLYPLGNTMAIAAITHQNDEVKEIGIRILEADCSEETLSILKSLDIKNPWLLAYQRQVIKDFEKELQLC